MRQAGGWFLTGAATVLLYGGMCATFAHYGPALAGTEMKVHTKHQLLPTSSGNAGPVAPASCAFKVPFGAYHEGVELGERHGAQYLVFKYRTLDGKRWAAWMGPLPDLMQAEVEVEEILP